MTAALPAAHNPSHPLWQAWQAANEGRRHRGGSSSSRNSSSALSGALHKLELQGLEQEGGLSWATAVELEMGLYTTHQSSA